MLCVMIEDTMVCVVIEDTMLCGDRGHYVVCVW